MPPRRRARSVQPPAASSGFFDLPDGVLTTVLQHLSQAERLQHAALVCKHFRHLSCSPELVHTTVVEIRGTAVGASSALAKARALLGWLAKHGKHVGKLDLLLEPSVGCSTAEKNELAALVAACLAACSGPAGQLEVLEVDRRTPLFTTAWLQAMPKLKDAAMGSYDEALTLTDGLHSLSALESLTLFGEPLQLPAQLPPCLTMLELCDRDNTEMPAQIAQLSRLRSLILMDCIYSQGGMRALTRLAPTLTSLKLDACAKLPPTLSALTGLHRLVLVETPEGGATAADALDASLRQLQQLTALALKDCIHDIPPAVSSLARLARFAVDGHHEGPGPLPQLPAGPWLRSLQVLHSHAGILAKSTGILAQAPQLESICVLGTPEQEGVTSDEWQAFYKWASVHKPLCRLTFDLGADGDGVDAPPDWQLFDDIMWLRSSRPNLEVYRYLSPNHPEPSIADF